LALKRDNNTDFFHRTANGRKRKQIIYFMQEGVDELLETKISFSMQLNTTKNRLAKEHGMLLSLRITYCLKIKGSLR
jgi:hypothetical protein